MTVCQSRFQPRRQMMWLRARRLVPAVASLRVRIQRIVQARVGTTPVILLAPQVQHGMHRRRSALMPIRPAILAYIPAIGP
jgi:hypothetical protein